MKHDPIVEEVRRVKERLAAKFNYDLDAMFADARSRECSSGHKVVRLKPRRLKPTAGVQPSAITT